MRAGSARSASSPTSTRDLLPEVDELREEDREDALGRQMDPRRPLQVQVRGDGDRLPDAGRLLGRACPHLTAEEQAAYDAPFPDIEHKAGVRAFPELLPEHPDADGAEISRQARTWLQGEGQGQSFMAIGMQDPVLTPPMMYALSRSIRNCQAPHEVAEGGHFLQEWGADVARQELTSWQV